MRLRRALLAVVVTGVLMTLGCLMIRQQESEDGLAVSRARVQQDSTGNLASQHTMGFKSVATPVASQDHNSPARIEGIQSPEQVQLEAGGQVVVGTHGRVGLGDEMVSRRFGPRGAIASHAQVSEQANSMNVTVVSGMLHVASSFHFPQPEAVLPLDKVLRAQWMQELWEVVHAMQCTQITMVTSNLSYKEVLLNWLISAIVRAKLPLETILVTAMDKSLHQLLQEKGMYSVLVTPASFLSLAAQAMGVFTQVMMTRLSIIRLLNHWGFDVVNYDTDAILLKDPQPVFDRLWGRGILGTFGKFPQSLFQQWGITLCTAVLVVRNTPETEFFWESLSTKRPSSFSDQERMNYGLRAMNISWRLPASLSSTVTEVEGVCGDGLRVSLLPYSFSCRGSNCVRSLNMREVYYVWHKGGSRDGVSKRRSAEAGNMWFLRKDWTTCCTAQQGYNWLSSIATSLVNV